MSKRDFRLYFADILDSGNDVFEFVKGWSFEQFCMDAVKGIMQTESESA